MTTSTHSNPPEIKRVAASRPTSHAVLVGLALAVLFVSQVPAHLPLVAWAMGPLGLSFGFLGVGLYRLRAWGEKSWGVMLGGQLLAVVAISLLFLASLR
jgi:hypothetical protein